MEGMSELERKRIGFSLSAAAGDGKTDGRAGAPDRSERPELPRRPAVGLVAERVLQVVLPVHPVGVMIVHAVDEHVVDLSLQEFGQPLGAGEHRGHHGVGPNAGAVQLVEGPDPLGDRGCPGLEERPDIVVRGRDGEPPLEVACAPDDVEVPEDERRAGLDHDRPAVRGQDLEALPGQAVVRFEGLVGVADAADPDLRPPLLFDLRPQEGRGVDLDVDELAPGLGVRGEPLHEPGVAVRAGVLAPGVGVDHPGVDLRLREDALRLDFAYGRRHFSPLPRSFGSVVTWLRSIRVSRTERGCGR